MVRPERSPASRVQVPLPLSVPADRTAPVGTPDTVTKSTDSPPCTSKERSSVIAVSSSPRTSSPAETVVSTIPSTVTAISVEADVPPSVEVAVTLSVKSSAEYAGGVIVNPSNAAKSSAPEIVHDPPPLSVPIDKVAPVGTPEISMESTVSVVTPSMATKMSRSIAVPSSPVTAPGTVTTGTSSTEAISKVTVAVLVPPWPSETE